MSREVRRTPVGWWPPVRDFPYGKQRPHPQHDRTYEEAVVEAEAEKKDFFDRIDYFREKYGQEGIQADIDHYESGAYKPDPAYYRPAWTDKERNGYQLYESVSEGTPLTPSFATPAALIKHLCTVGAHHDGVLTREQAEAIVGVGWAPSFVSRGGQVSGAYDAAADHARSQQDS